jgi:hypothetical protein
VSSEYREITKNSVFLVLFADCKRSKHNFNRSSSIFQSSSSNAPFSLAMNISIAGLNLFSLFSIAYVEFQRVSTSRITTSPSDVKAMLHALTSREKAWDFWGELRIHKTIFLKREIVDPMSLYSVRSPLFSFSNSSISY